MWPNRPLHGAFEKNKANFDGDVCADLGTSAKSKNAKRSQFARRQAR